MNKKILHICFSEKFIPDYINFMRKNIGTHNQSFFFLRSKYRYRVSPGKEIIEFNNEIERYLNLLLHANNSNKIIIHGLFKLKLVCFLAFQPWLLRKCYWIIWGGDLYKFNNPHKTFKERAEEYLRRQVIKNIGHIVTHVKGDFELAKTWYGNNGIFHNSFVYPSNIFKEFPNHKHKKNKIFIQVCNSYDPSNNHLEVFDLLKAFKSRDIQIFCPLSYGDPVYAREISNKGAELFGENFTPMLNFLSVEEYLIYQSEIDIAIFAHRRQQAMSNIVTLLGLGKKVFIRSDVSHWTTFFEMGICVYDINALNLDPISTEAVKNNIEKIRNEFSSERLIETTIKYLEF